jgi:hypothetical protein
MLVAWKWGIFSVEFDGDDTYESISVANNAAVTIPIVEETREAFRGSISDE